MRFSDVLVPTAVIAALLMIYQLPEGNQSVGGSAMLPVAFNAASVGGCSHSGRSDIYKPCSKNDVSGGIGGLMVGSPFFLLFPAVAADSVKTSQASGVYKI